MKEKDIVEDIFCRVKTILGQQFNGEIDIKLQHEERRIRNDWGGTEPYIHKKCDKTELKRLAIEQVNQGIPVNKVAKNTGISRTQVYLLLKTRK